MTNTPTPREILTKIARDHFLSLPEIQHPGKGNYLVTRARSACIHALRAEGFTLCQIGSILLISHTSVLYHLRKGNHGK